MKRKYNLINNFINHHGFNKLGILLFLFFAWSRLMAQTIQIPRIIPPSSAGQTIMRYGEIPVDYSTGVPNIEIPLYTLEGKELKIPISITYHSSGIKVEDIASEVGLGWALNCGGIVSRTVNGIRDEAKASQRTFFTAEHLMDSVAEVAPHYDPASTRLDSIIYFEYFFKQIFDNEEDPMNDRYFYKLPNGSSGGFTYSYYDVNEDTAITLPYRPLKIEKYISGTTTTAKIDSFKITDDNGTIYTFQPYLINAPGTCSEWFLTKMISGDRTDTITFNYIEQTGNSSIETASWVYQGWSKDIGSGCSPLNTTSSLSESLLQLPDFNTPVLQSIISSKAIINFYYASDRSDFSFLKRLSEITIAPRNSPDNVIKSVHFTPLYFGTTAENKRLGLDSVVISAAGDLQPQKYSFTYESQVLPPYPSKMNIPKYNEDFWGYYNGSNSNTLIPSDFISDTNDKQYYGGDRDPDGGYYSKACMLKEIKYPTGGRTVFLFERNYAYGIYPYKGGSGDGYVGGFRVRSITNYDDSDKIANVKTYEYNGVRARPITKDYFSYDQQLAENGGSNDGLGTACWADDTREMVFSNPILPLEVAAGLPIMYTTVVEYNGTPTSNAGKTVYEYGEPYSPSDFDANLEHPLEYEAKWFYHPYHYDRGDYIPELISKSEYSFDGINYHPVSKEQNEYTELYTTEFNTGIKLSRPKQYVDPNYFEFSGCGIVPCNLEPTINEYVQSIVAIDTKAYREAPLLTNSKTYIFNPLDSTKYVLTNTDYTYNQNNLAIQEKSRLSSKDDTLKVFYKYPSDFSGTTVYDTMVRHNIISPVIETLSDKNSNFLQSTKTNYNYWYNNTWGNNNINSIIVPQTVETKTLDNNTEIRLRYDSYDDKGNIITVSKENDVLNSFLWDYDHSYPIAEVTNAGQSDIAYTSFEADGTGNWNSYTGTITTVATSPFPPTGTKYYNLTAGATLSKTVISGKTYIISYWSKNGLYSISGGSGTSVTGRMFNNWTYYEHKITASSTTLTISGTGAIDEVRLYPFGAQMTTYTYQPLVGMTSQCDANNKITYYQYDGFGRLMLIKDQNGNILKEYCYNYSGQQGGCTVIGNAAISQNFTKNDCGSGMSGSVVTYTVAANSYYASTQTDANAMAQNDITANGQAYANTNGTCTATLINIQGYNSKSTTYQVRFTNNSTNNWYTFNLTANTSSAVSLGQVPAGTYTVLFYPAGSQVTATYNINGYTQSNQTGATFYNIPITATSTASMY